MGTIFKLDHAIICIIKNTSCHRGYKSKKVELISPSKHSFLNEIWVNGDFEKKGKSAWFIAMQLSTQTEGTVTNTISLLKMLKYWKMVKICHGKGCL